jgi:hypothetical protein
VKHPKLWAVLTWALSLLAGGLALVLADFGAPAWAFGLLLAWLATVGLPTLLAVLLLAALWGRLPGLSLPFLEAAMAAMALLGLGFQIGAFLLLARVLRRWKGKRLGPVAA